MSRASAVSAGFVSGNLAPLPIVGAFFAAVTAIKILIDIVDNKSIRMTAKVQGRIDNQDVTIGVCDANGTFRVFSDADQILSAVKTFLPQATSVILEVADTSKLFSLPKLSGNPATLKAQNLQKARDEKAKSLTKKTDLAAKVAAFASYATGNVREIQFYNDLLATQQTADKVDAYWAAEIVRLAPVA